MAKRIYFETIKQNALKYGLPAGIATFALLFWYLVLIGSIVITGHSGDMTCKGTLEDPCLAYINFTANEDIFIYPVNYDPYGRNTPFGTDKELREWHIYRSWGSGWREIKLNETCTDTWCGAPPNSPDNKYAFAFREGRDYQIKIVAYKIKPDENIKWSFGQLDPTWYSIDSFILEDNLYVNELSDVKSKITNDGIVELSKWNNESFLKLIPVDNFKFSITDNKKIELENTRIKLDYYIKNNTAFEYEIILKEEPKSNVINIPIETKNLKFYYQSPLNEEMNNQSCNATDCGNAHRPENVVGSYAVYHSSKKDNEYQTGKAFHIYRPLIIDSENVSTYAELEIENDVLTIIIDKDWLSDKAVYPVVIDPTFGYVTEGSSNSVWSADYLICHNYSISQSGVIINFSFYGRLSSNNGMIFGAYDNSGSNLAGGSDTFAMTTTLQWWNVNLNSSIGDGGIFTDGEGYLCFLSPVSVYEYWDDVGSKETYSSSPVYPTLPSTCPTSSYASRTASHYVTYSSELPFSILSSPADNYESDADTITFECNATDLQNLGNVTWYLWNSTDDEINSSSKDWSGISNSTTFQHTFTTSDYDTYKWNCLVYDNDSNFDWASNRTLIITDLTYPLFSNYWDDNATLVDTGTGHFNVTLANTNGTVLLEINNTNVTATNLTSNVYNASYDFTKGGAYTYRWHSWGNGTLENYNVSGDRSYTVNYSFALDILDPTTSSPKETQDGANITVIFLFTEGESNVTSGVTINNITIGGVQATVVSSGTGATYPIDFEDMEGYSEGTQPNPIGNWTQAGAGVDTDDWYVYTGNGESSGTGPTADYDGYYAMVETSSGACTNPDTAVLYRSPAIDFDIYDVVNVSFAYNMYGSTMGNLSIRENSTGSWVTEWSLAGDQGTDWFVEEVSLTGKSGTGNIAIWMACGNSYTSDAAVDSVNITAYTTISEEFAWVAGSGWNVNVTVPTLGAGTYDLFVNASYSGNEESDTETNAIEIAGDSNPTSILSYPADNNVSPLSTIEFQCNATDDNNLVNVTWYLWNSTSNEDNSSTQTWTGTSNSTTFSHTFTYYDSYKWNCLVFDNASQSDWAANYTINISDTELSITDPTTASPNTTSAGSNITITFDWLEDGVNITSDVTLNNITMGDVQANVVQSGGASSGNYINDDFESDFTNWEANANWGRNDSKPNDGSWSMYSAHSGGQTADCVDTGLCYFENWAEANSYVNTTAVDMSDCDESYLTFDIYYSIEMDVGCDYDYGKITASVDGSTWNNINPYGVEYCGEGGQQEAMVGSSETWNNKTVINMTSYCGNSSVKVRFSFKSDSSVNHNGIYIDNFVWNWTSGSAAVDEFGYVAGVGWQANVTVPVLDDGSYDLFVNASYDGTAETDTETNAVILGVGGAPDINYSVALPNGVIRFLNCSPDFENPDSRPDGQTTTIASINATNNGTAEGSFTINLTGALNTGWTIWASNDSLVTNITLNTTAQTIWSGVSASETKQIWLAANCSFVSANPGQSISMWAV